MYYDAHTHLNDERLFTDRTKHVDDFIAVGGKGLICVGTDELMNTRAVQIAREAQVFYEGQCSIKATVGVHPSEIVFEKIASSQDITDSMRVVEDLLEVASGEIVGIGECGLDGHYPGFDSTRGLQMRLFEAHCELARRMQMPIVVHSRDAFIETMGVLSGYQDLKIYLHCRGYTLMELEQVLDLFPQIRIGFCGNITYPQASDLRDCVSLLCQHSAFRTGRAHLLLETDAPRLSPQSQRGKTNTPAYITDLYRAVAELIHYPEIQLSQIIADHRSALYEGR